jgi:uncharacterized protein YndB with AHSA1/START domain
MNNLVLTRPPSMEVGMLIRRPPPDVFQAIVDPAITTKFWYTKSSGKMTPGAELNWQWEMYSVSSNVAVLEVEENRLVRFEWSGYSPDQPTTVEFRFRLFDDEATYVQITEVGFSGDGDRLVECATDSTAGFAFLLSSLKAFLEHDVILSVTLDAHPERVER